MAEFRLKAHETRVLREAIEAGLPVNNIKGAATARRIAKLLGRIEKRQGAQEIYLELPDADQVTA